MAEDWSLVRSPSRALRRLKQGHRQNVREMTEAEIEAVTKAMHAEARRILLREDVEALKTLSVGLEP